MKILTALITFNRLELLKRCVKSIKNQTIKHNDILVINNSSTDGTEDFLKNLDLNYITQPNLGSASGWYKCIEYAIENNYDYIWLMDDDGYPEFNSLEKLIDAHALKKNLVCVSSVLLNEKNKNQLVFPLPILNKNGEPVIFKNKRKFYFLDELISQGFLYYPYVQLFNGSLISVETLKNLGNVEKNYFIFGEEVDFFWRMKKFGDVETRLDAYHYHPRVDKRKYTNLKIYYYIKNSIINNYKHLSNVQLRNILSLVVILFRVYKRNSLNESISLLLGSKNKLFYKALFRGYKKIPYIDHDL